MARLQHWLPPPLGTPGSTDECRAWGSLSAGASFDAFGFMIWCAVRATTSYTVRVLPSFGVNWRVWSVPSTKMLSPFSYVAAMSARSP